MTTTNRRQLARVRNAFLGATALTGVAIAATPASAVVINDNFTPTQVVDATNVTGVGQMVIDLQNGFIGLCTVTLINPRTVIFASHCVNENPAGNAFEPGTGYGKANGGLPIGFFFNANNNQAGNSAIGHWLNGVAGGPKDLTRTAENAYNSNFVVYDKNCCTIGLGNNFLQADVAMAALDTPAVGVPVWTLLFSPLSAPVHSTIVGYGDNGTGTTGQGTIDFKRRVAENLISVLGSLDDQDTFLFGAPDGLPANLYMIDFNDPKFGTAQANVFDFNIFHDTAYTREGITAPGDSGGPLIVDHAFTTPTIAAVLSGGDRFFNAQKGASYGTTSFYQPLYLYWDWILANNPYKYVTSAAGNHAWADSDAFVMALDPAYMVTNGASTTLVNGLPTTAAAGITNQPPGFGLVCYYDDCVNIKTGVHTNPTPAPGPNPTGGTVGAPDGSDVSADMAVVSASTLDGSSAQAPQGSRPFGGALGIAGFEALVDSMVSASTGCASGPALVAVSDLNAGNETVADVACTPSAGAPGAGGSGAGGGASLSAQSDWTNPEGTALAGGVQVQGAPGAAVGQLVNNKEANTGAATPARYYDVTIGAAGTITLNGATITVDKLTVNGASAGLTIGSTGVLNTLISSNSFAGNLIVNGVLNAAGGVNMFGGVLMGTGTVNGPTGFLIGAVAPGTVGTIGTLTINGAVGLGIGSTTVIDFTRTTSDLLAVNGAVSLSGTALFSQLDGGEQGDSHVFLTATGGITGAYAAVPDSIAGVLFPVVTKQTVAGVDREIVTLQAGSFVSVLAGSGTADQTTIAHALDVARAGSYNAMLPLYLAIDPLSGAALGQALENLAPDGLRTATEVGDMQTGAFDGIIWSHLGEIGGGAHSQTAFNVDATGLKTALSSATGSTAQAQQLFAIGQAIATNPGGGNEAISTGTAAAPTPAEDGGMMLPAGAGGFLSGSSLDGSVAVGGGGGRADVRGMIIAGGLDTPVGDGFTIGGSFAYSDVTTNLRAVPSSVQSNALQGALYARYDFAGDWIAQAFASYGHQTIETRRLVTVGLTTFALQGHTGGDSPSFGAYIGRSFGITTKDDSVLTVIPSLSLQYMNSGIDGYTETGGAPAMTFAGFSSSSFLGRLGIDAKMSFDLIGLRVTPSVGAFWVDNFEGNNGTINAAFAAAPSAIMTFGTAARDRSYGQFNLGASIDLGEVFGTEASLSGRYDADTRSDVSAEAWTGRLSIKF